MVSSMRFMAGVRAAPFAAALWSDWWYWAIVAVLECALFIVMLGAWSAGGAAAPDAAACAASADRAIPALVVFGTLKALPAAAAACYSLKRRARGGRGSLFTRVESAYVLLTGVVATGGLQVIAAMSDECLVAIGGAVWVGIKLLTWAAVAEVAAALILFLVCAHRA